MPVSELLKSPFSTGNHYHIVFKSIDGILLFRNDTDYYIFLERFFQFNAFVFDTWAYCLLNNHAHLIVKTKSVEEVLKSINERDQAMQTVAMKKLLAAPGAVEVFDEMAERQCNSFMVSYANYIKNKYQHHGGLFQSPFKRKVIDKDTYLQMAIIYVHANPLKHTISGDYKKYPYSSYDAILKNNSVNCAAAEVLLFFAGVDQYVLLHEEQVKYYYATGFPNSKLE